MSATEQGSEGDELDGWADDVDPERIRECEYWRCRDLFEIRTSNQIFCRKACRSRQRKWERSQARKAAKKQARSR